MPIQNLRALPSSFILFCQGGGITPCAIWPKRKKPEYTNKGIGLLQAQLKLVYYTAPFEINVGGSGRAKRSGFSLLAFFCLSSLLSDILGNIGYRKYCDLQV